MQTLAERSYQSNTLTRLIGTLYGHSGQVLALSGSKISLTKLVKFYQQVVAYPVAERIWIVQDNWPVHFHPDVLAALEPQLILFPFPQPPPNAGARCTCPSNW